MAKPQPLDMGMASFGANKKVRSMDMIRFHQRRTAVVQLAWMQAVAFDCPDDMTRCRAAWDNLGLFGRMDAPDFKVLLAADLEEHGAPADWPGFVAQYDRLYARRSQLFAELYQVIKPLGEGGFGTVSLARRESPISPESNGDFAVKYVNKGSLTARAAVHAESEMRLWQRVVHSGVARLYAVYDLHYAHVLVTELCMGGCLLDRLLEAESFDEAHAKAIGGQIAGAVIHLHANGIVHRDIKPENVLCTDAQPHPKGHVTLCDFGMASEFDHKLDGSLMNLVGTPEYVAPEVVLRLEMRKKGELDVPMYSEAVDLWSLGVMLYELLAGEPPFYAEDDAEQYRLTKSAPLSFPPESFEHVSKEATSLISSLLERDPSQRADSAALGAAEWLKAPLDRNQASGRLMNRQESAKRMNSRRKNRRLKAAGHAVTASIRLNETRSAERQGRSSDSPERRAGRFSGWKSGRLELADDALAADAQAKASSDTPSAVERKLQFATP